MSEWVSVSGWVYMNMHTRVHESIGVCANVHLRKHVCLRQRRRGRGEREEQEEATDGGIDAECNGGHFEHKGRL